MRKNRRNKSVCLEKISCPDCELQPNTHLQTFNNIDESLGVEWFTSFCMGPCYEAKGDPYGEKVAPKKKFKTPEQLKEETDDVKSCKLFAPSVPYRGIPAEYYEKFSCRLLLSEFDGKTPHGIAFPYSDYGKLCGYKARAFKLASNGKKIMYALGRTADADPFGLARAMYYLEDTLWMTEGEFDTIALEYCMQLVTPCKGYPVVSLTAGGGSIEKNLEYIESRIKRKIKYLVLVLDDDEVGHLAEETARELWGDKVIVIPKPKGSNDTNDAVKNNQAVEMGKLALNFTRT
jgi:hypothetical protein